MLTGNLEFIGQLQTVLSSLNNQSTISICVYKVKLFLGGESGDEAGQSVDGSLERQNGAQAS